MKASKEEEIISLLNGLYGRLEYIEAQVEYTQSILGSFHPDPVIRNHCQHHLRTGAEEVYSDYTVKRLTDQFPMKDVDSFLRGILQEAVQKLDAAAIRIHQEAC